MSEDLKDLGILAVIGVGVYLLAKSGIPKGINDLFEGKPGAALGDKVFNINITPGYDINDYTTYDPAYGTGNQNLGTALFDNPAGNPITNPIEYFGNIFAGNTGSQVEVSATDAAFAKIGLTTQKMEFITNKYGDAVVRSIIAKLGQNNTAGLTSTELAALRSVDWPYINNMAAYSYGGSGSSTSGSAKLTISPASGAKNSQRTIVYSGFQPFATVYFERINGGGSWSVTADSNGNGSFALAFGESAGTWIIRASDNINVATARFVVV
jgi:hypothetical protein